MNQVGPLIERRRRELGLSREDLAKRIGVTAQTVLNLEHDDTYNLGTRLLGLLEKALRVEFRISIEEEAIVNERIRMGNDEFILHIRKHHPTRLGNKLIARRTWEYLRDHADGVKVAADQPCMWANTGEPRAHDALPLTAAQFEFRSDALPAVFRFLRDMARREPVGGVPSRWQVTEEDLNPFQVEDP